MTKRNYFILFLLALIFMAPGLSAYLYYRNPEWLGTSRTNKGKLFTPPVLINPLVDNEDKWKLVFWYPNDCNQACVSELDKLARVRLSLGRHLYKVDLLLMKKTDQNSLPYELVQTMNQQGIKRTVLETDQSASYSFLSSDPKVFLANSQGYLILEYPSPVEPASLYHDLKQLITSGKKSG